MSGRVTWATLLAVTCLSGCVTPPPVVLHQPVGPWKPRPQASDGAGKLVVYSATRVTMADDSEYPVHTPYTVYDTGQKVLKEVDNRAGLFSQSPAAVLLPPGQYTVKALAADAGYVIVPVVIESRQTTVVDLDGSVLGQTAADESAEWVRMPNGQVVGAPGSAPGAMR